MGNFRNPLIIVDASKSHAQCVGNLYFVSGNIKKGG